jgi:N-formylglutamate deformylase
MNDVDFLRQFENGRLAPEAFDHRAHLRLAVLYLRSHPFLEACIAMRDGLQRFAARIGKAGLYHETITVAFMSVVNEALADLPEADWATLIQARPELCDRQLLARLYGEARLKSDLARGSFVLPVGMQ